MMTEEWGPWIEHDGMGCPPEVRGRIVHAFFEAPDEQPLEHEGLLVDAVIACCDSWNGAAYGWQGGWTGRWMGKEIPMRWVTRYRIKRLAAAQGIAALIESLPERQPA